MKAWLDFVKTSEDGQIPKKGAEKDAGYDLFSADGCVNKLLSFCVDFNRSTTQTVCLSLFNIFRFKFKPWSL